MAAHPLWFAGSLLAVVASGRLLVASLGGRSAVVASLAAGAFVLWCVLAVLFFWGET
jgi:hypothetical protein